MLRAFYHILQKRQILVQLANALDLLGLYQKTAPGRKDGPTKMASPNDEAFLFRNVVPELDPQIRIAHKGFLFAKHYLFLGHFLLSHSLSPATIIYVFSDQSW